MSDGENPQAELVQGTEGNFYGTTNGGGASNVGGVFKITSGGTLTVLHSFGGIADGANPQAGLVQGTDGNFYGTTNTGGASNVGEVFKITSGGTLTVLHSFGGLSDGENPQAGLVQGTDQKFYGTTNAGGASNVGVVLSLDMGFPVLTPATATYATQHVGTTSAAKVFTLTNNLSVTLTTIVVSTTGDFAVSSKTCTATLAAHGTCTISVVFKPTAIGLRTGSLKVTDSAPNSPQTSTLSGTGN